MKLTFFDSAKNLMYSEKGVYKPDSGWLIGDSKGTTKKACDKDFAERSAELPGAICLKNIVVQGNDRQPPQIVLKILWCCSRMLFWLCGSSLAPEFIDRTLGELKNQGLFTKLNGFLSVDILQKEGNIQN